MHFQFIGHIKGEHQRDVDQVDTVEAAKQIVDRFLDVSDTDQDTQVVVSRSDSVDGIAVFVDPETSYATLAWSGHLRSKNPYPFADAPLIAENYDDDPPTHFLRNSYVSLETAREALHQYLETGLQPTNLQWQPNRYEVYEYPRWVADNPDSTDHYVLIDRSSVD